MLTGVTGGLSESRGRERERERDWCKLSSPFDRRRWSCSSNWLQAVFVHSGLLLLLRWWRPPTRSIDLLGNIVCLSAPFFSQMSSTCFFSFSFHLSLALPFSSFHSTNHSFLLYPLLPLPHRHLPHQHISFGGLWAKPWRQMDDDEWYGQLNFSFSHPCPIFLLSSADCLSHGQDFVVFDALVLRLMRMCFREASWNNFRWLGPIAFSLASKTSVA